MTKAAITEVTHDPLEGEELAPSSSAWAGLSTAALPNAVGAVGLAEAGFVRKVLPTKVLSSTNMEFEGDLVGGWRGNATTRSSPAGCGRRPCTVPAVFRRGRTSAASAGSPGTISTSRAGSRRCHNTRRDPIRATCSGTRPRQQRRGTCGTGTAIHHRHRRRRGHHRPPQRRSPRQESVGAAVQEREPIDHVLRHPYRRRRVPLAIRERPEGDVRLAVDRHPHHRRRPPPHAIPRRRVVPVHLQLVACLLGERGGSRRWSRRGEEGRGGEQCGVESVFCGSRSTSIYLALSYEASEICKLSRKLPADFQELPLSAVTRLVRTPPPPVHRHHQITASGRDP
jgi:hypothetical protein